MLSLWKTLLAAALLSLPAAALAGGVITEGYSANPTSNSVQKDSTRNKEQQVYLFAALLLNGHAKAIEDDEDQTASPGVVVANIVDDPESGPQVGCAQAPGSLLLAAIPLGMAFARRRRPRLGRS